MKELVPFFELNGKTYEVNKTRWILAEYDKLTDRNELSAEDKANAIKIQSLAGDVRRYAELMRKHWEIFEESFDDEAERKYLKAKSLYDNALEQLTKLEVESGSSERLRRAGINTLEKVAIKGLAEQYFEFNEEKATELWKEYVENVGKANAVEWLEAMAECLFDNEENENGNDFLSQMRKKAEENANNRKNGLKMVK
jgi:hypothetical protein